MTTQEKTKQLMDLRRQVKAGGGEEAVARQHKVGKLTARERLDRLLDPGSFQELELFASHHCTDFGMEKISIPADGVVCGVGRVRGRRVCVYAQDFTTRGGSLGLRHAEKICKVLDLSAGLGIPVVGINDSGGARIQEGIDALSGYGSIFFRNVRNSGLVPQISLIMGPCAGGAAYSPALTDLVIMVEDESQMFVTGPAVLESITGETVSAQELGGAQTHGSVSGVAHLIAPDEDTALTLAADLLSYLPDYAGASIPDQSYQSKTEARPELDEVIPDDSRFPYDMKEVIDQVADPDTFLELQPDYADNLIVGFARIGGHPVGILANQPYSMGGCLDINASDKGARFIQLCDAFSLPLINLVDVPGFLPGMDQEHGGIIRHGAKLLYAYASSETPKITVILRKAYGGSYMAMCSKEMGADLVYAWPTAEIAVMGAEGAANVIFQKEIRASSDPQRTRQEKIQAYEERFSSPYLAASRGYVDEVIAPSETRERLLAALELLKTKPHPIRRKGNMPL